MKVSPPNRPAKHLKRRVPWMMCRTCHRIGTPSRRSPYKCPLHPVGTIGDCGQCGKRRPLVTCHAYDFRKPIPKVNVRRKAKRKVAYRKMLGSKEYLAAKAEALERAGNQCEQEDVPTFHFGLLSGNYEDRQRCLTVAYPDEPLHAHHLRYPKSRKLRADDLKILCRFHHEQTEGLKMHKTRMY